MTPTDEQIREVRDRLRQGAGLDTQWDAAALLSAWLEERAALRSQAALSDDCKRQIDNLVDWYMHGDCDSVHDVLCQLAEWCYADAAKLAAPKPEEKP